MFPRPTADPAVARTNPKRLENPLLSLLIILSTFFHIYIQIRKDMYLALPEILDMNPAWQDSQPGC